MDVSIIIPTMNRPKLLLRLIHYYGLLEFRGKILIGDSSNAEIFQKTASALENYKGCLDICHRHLPGRSVATAVMDMNEYLRTPYVCLAPDDDFIIPQTIAKCIQFLDSYPDYIAAHGVGAFITNSSGDSEIIDNAGYYRQTIIDDVTASTRLRNHLKNYSVNLFSVHRSEIWRKMFISTPTPSEWPQCCDKSFADELLPCCLSVVYGKIKQIDGLYLIRQVHEERYLLPTWFTWFSNENWRPSYLYFRNQLAQAISCEDRISISQAESIVDSSFSVYMRGGAKVAAPVHWFRKFARKSQAWHALRQLRVRLQPIRIICLSSLSSPSSPFYQDFLPVLNAVTRANTRK